MPYLASVKDALVSRFAEAYDEMTEQLGDDLPTVVVDELQKLQRDTWTLVEEKLKESYRNGQAAAQGSAVPAAKGGSPGNPFRK